MFTVKLDTNFIPLTLYRDLPAGISKTLPGNEQRSGELAGMASVVFNFASGVAAGVLASWIWEKVKATQSTTIIRINNKITRTDESEIRTTLEQIIEIQKH